MLAALIYISKDIKGFEKEDLLTLATNAAKKNNLFKISGFLVYHQAHFIQYLEGPTDALKNLMKNIENDNRHLVNHTIWHSGLESRRFKDWGLKLFNTNIALEHILYDYMFLLSNSVNIESSEKEEANQRIQKQIWLILNKIQAKNNKRIGYFKTLGQDQIL